MIEVMRRATGEEPHMWGSIVGFGAYHYKYTRGREGDTPPDSPPARRRQPSTSWTGYTALTAGTYTKRAREGGKS